ncbi:hypothetical protein D9M71_625270 [compost metagenome]|nr:hypothetical protein A7K61_21820 [Pseudomonas sp. AP42]
MGHARGKGPQYREIFCPHSVFQHVRQARGHYIERPRYMVDFVVTGLFSQAITEVAHGQLMSAL